MSDEDYMRLAIEEAKKASQQGNWPIGCVLVLDDNIIARSHNKIYSTKNRIGHAEINALNSVQELVFNNPKKITLYTTFEPCPMCFGACINSRIKRVVYGGDYNGSGGVHLKDYLKYLYDADQYQTEFEGGILEQECEELFKSGEATAVKNQIVSDNLQNKL